MDLVITYWENAYYTHLVNFALVLAASALTIVKWQKKSIYNYLLIVFVSYLLVHTLSMVDLVTRHRYDPWIEIAFLLFELLNTMIELIIFCILIKSGIKSPLYRRILFFCPLALIAYLLLTLIFGNYNWTIQTKLLPNFFTVQAILLAVACFCYFKDLFQSKTPIAISNEPSFWIATGVSFLVIGSLPFSIFSLAIIEINFKLYVRLFTIFNVFYSVLFIMLIKSLLCRSDLNSKQCKLANYAQ